ncbi:MAG: extracellular solute-binding protein [Eubacteriales bacterium]
MKNILVLFLAMTFMLGGCGNYNKMSNSNPEEAITLSVWHYYGGTAQQTFEYLVQKFNQTVGEENNIIVESYSYSSVSELSIAIETSAANMTGASPMPSIFASYSDSVIPLKEAGLIADLSNYFSQEELDMYYLHFIEEGKMQDDDSLWILPIAKSTEILHINQTVFDEFAAQTDCTYDMLETWEGIVEVSELYYEWTDNQTDFAYDGSAFFGTDGIANFMIIGTKQLGNDIFEMKNGVITHNFTEEVARNIWEVYYVPFIKGYFSAEASYRSDDLASGEIVAYVGSTASSYYFPAQSQNEDGQYVDTICKTMTYPIFANGDAVAVQQGAGMVVSKSTPQVEEAAALFLKWFTEAENNCGFAVSTGYMPVKNEVLDIDVILEEMARDGSIDDSLPIIQATKSSYEQLEEYELYTSIPFDGSADAREILEYSLVDKISSDQEQIEKRISSDEIYQDIVDEFIAEENFQTWYQDISAQLDDVIAGE